MQELRIATKDGFAPAFLFRPTQATDAVTRGILFYMDATGPRPSLFEMAQRLANAGYIVLMPDLFYRFGDYGPFDGASFSDPGKRAKILGMLHDTKQEMTSRDTWHFLDVLSENGAEDKVAVVGYCMGGGRAITAAGHYPDRILAAASFHGGDLATDAPDSPHWVAPQITGRIYVGVAGVDSSFPPEQSARLAEALRSGEVDHVIENYVSARHGWTVRDHSTHDPKQAERHWKRLYEFLDESFAWVGPSFTGG